MNDDSNDALQNIRLRPLTLLVLTGMLAATLAGCSGSSSNNHEQATSKTAVDNQFQKNTLRSNSNLLTATEARALTDRAKASVEALEKLTVIKEADVIRNNKKAYIFSFPDIKLGEFYRYPSNHFYNFLCLARNGVCVPADMPIGLKIAGQEAVTMLKAPSIFKKIPGSYFQGLMLFAPTDSLNVMGMAGEEAPEVMEKEVVGALQNLDGWTNLVSIQLNNCPLNQDALAALNQFKKLRSLTIAQCELEPKIFTKQPFLAKLTDLRLYESRFDYTPIIKYLRTSSNLKTLAVDNHISIDNLQDLQHCVALESLEIMSGEINDETIAALCKLKKLKRVQLLHMTLSEHQMKMLTNCPWLKDIALSQQTYEYKSESVKALDSRITFQ